MNIVKGKTYRIKGQLKYFAEKYGTDSPLIVIEGKDWEVFGKRWIDTQGNPTCLSYAVRAGLGGLPKNGTVYYGHIGGFGELAHETELEEVKS